MEELLRIVQRLDDRVSGLEYEIQRLHGAIDDLNDTCFYLESQVDYLIGRIEP